MKNFLSTLILSLLMSGFMFGQSNFVTQWQDDETSFPNPVKAYGWNWLYTGVWGAGSNTNIGLDGAGIWYAGIILNLSTHIGDTITKIGYYHGDSATVTARVYTGNYQNPLIQVAESSPQTITTAGWQQNVMLLNPVPITSPGLYWIVLVVQDPGQDFYPIGSRVPLNPNAGRLSLDGTTWTDLSNYSINNSWMIGAYVHSACPPPKNLTATNVGPYSANLSWATQVGGTPSSWEIQYGHAGFTPGSGLTATSTLTSATLLNLDHSTQYQFYVRAVCGTTDTSTWIGPASFETEFVNDQANILSYYFGHGGEIDNIDDPNITVSIPGSPDLSNLVAHFTVSPGVREIKVAGVDQISGQTPNNFYTPVIYSILAEDSITVKNWLVIVNGYNSITEMDNARFAMFPNPAGDVVNILCADGSMIRLFDQTGKEVLVHQTEKIITSLNISWLPEGLYLIKMSDAEGEIIRKMIKY
jgi:hypothetical protein